MFGRKRVKPIDLKNLDQLKDLLAEGKPMLLDFWRVGCRSCKIMDGIVNELAEEYGTSAHVVKIDVGRVAGAAASFQVKGTPTFIVFGRPGLPAAKKKAKRRPAPAPERQQGLVVKWRGSGLVRKDMMTRAMESAGAVPVAGD